MTCIPAAVNTLDKRGCNAALPETIVLNLPPKASRHLLKINLLARPNFFLYHHPLRSYGSYFNPTSTAQKNSIFFIPVSAPPFAIILSYTFSSNRGTTVIKCGRTSLILSEILSRPSPKYTEVPEYIYK